MRRKLPAVGFSVCGLLCGLIHPSYSAPSDFSMGASPMNWTVGNLPRADYMPLNLQGQETPNSTVREALHKIRLNPLAVMPTIDAPDISALKEQFSEIGEIEKLSHVVQRSVISDNRSFAWGSLGNLDTKFRLGMASKLLRPRVPNLNTDNLVTAEMGMDYDLQRFHDLTAGLSVNNDALPLHANFRLGGSIGPVAAEMSARHFISEQITSMGTGLKYSIGVVALHAGYHVLAGTARTLNSSNLSAEDKALQGVSGGFGVRKGATQVDYSISKPPYEPGPTQNITLTIRWDAPKAPLH